MAVRSTSDRSAMMTSSVLRGPIGPLVEPVNLASLPDYLEQVPVVRIVGAVHEPLDPVGQTGKKPD